MSNPMDNLEEQLAKLEWEMGRMQNINTWVVAMEKFFSKVEEGLGWIEDRQYVLEDRVDMMEDKEDEPDDSGKGSAGSLSPLTMVP